MSKAAQHMRPAPEPERRPIHLQVVIVLALSALGALFLEAGTLFGSFAYSVRDLSVWMPKRMLVFFALLLIPNTLLVRASERRPLRERVADALPTVARRALICAAAIAAGIGLGYVAGSQLARLAGDAGDARYSIAAAGACSALLLLVVNLKAIRGAAEWGFLIIALCFGSTFCLLMPTAAEISWDGQIHFKNANAISYVFDAEYSGADVLMTQGGEQGALYQIGDLESIEHSEVELNSREVSFPHPGLEDGAVDRGNEALRNAEAQMPVVQLKGTALFPQDSYVSANMLGRIPNAAGLWVGRLLRLDCVGRYTLSRLFNTWFYAIVFFFAIRALKNGKLIMAAIGLCPTTLFEAANFSYDPWSIGLISLSMGLFVGKLQKDGELHVRDSLQCLVPFVLGAYVRAVVFPLALVFALVPRHRFGSTKAWIAHLLVVLGGIGLLLSSFAIPYVTSLAQGTSASDTRGGSDVDSAQQVAYVLAHPFQTLRMSLVFGLRMLNPVNLGLALDPSDESLLYYFPYLIPTNAPLSEVLAAVESIIVLLPSLFDGGQEDESFAAARYKVGGIVATGLAFALLCGALYVGFTAVGRDTISGVQQRYLLGLMATFLLLVPNIAFRRKYARGWLLPTCLASEVIVLTVVTWNSFVWAF